jgi:hypothetical protein
LFNFYFPITPSVKVTSTETLSAYFMPKLQCLRGCLPHRRYLIKIDWRKELNWQSRV